ncbi:MAG TPA: hypothetical protein VL949_06895 [Geobacteraceae bacterium]|nr:hypothetical protein [Geobacteraceae bacterium]
MIGHMAGQMKPGPKASHVCAREQKTEYAFQRAEILRTIDGLHALTRPGLWRLLMFLVASAVSLRFRDCDLFAALPEHVREFVGAPPPLALIHVVLAVSTVSTLIIIGGRRAEDAGAGRSWCQFAFAVFFYPLYALVNGLDEFFPAIFAAGLTILAFEHFTVSTRAFRAIRQERARLEGMT